MGERAPTPKLATWEDVLAHPGERPVELIGGVIVDRAQPTFEHSDAQFAIGELLGPFRRKGGGQGPGGWWLGTEVDVLYETHELYRHDLAGWRRERVVEKPRGRPVRVHPDWACEILSPSNWAHDTVSKFRTLQRLAIPFYWVVDVEHGVLTAYRHAHGEYAVAAVARPGERARIPPFEAVELEVGVLFGADRSD